MESAEFGKYKNKVFNFAVIFLAIIVALSIYSKQARDVELLKNTKEVEKKKNIVLEDIGRLELKVDAYKELLVGKDTELIIGNISNMAKESGVKIISMRPEMEQKYPDYIKLPFSLAINAFDYHSLGDFVSRIESHPDIYVIEDVRIYPLSEKEGLTVNLKLSAIVFAK